MRNALVLKLVKEEMIKLVLNKGGLVLGNSKSKADLFINISKIDYITLADELNSIYRAFGVPLLPISESAFTEDFVHNLQSGFISVYDEVDNLVGFHVFMKKLRKKIFVPGNIILY